MLHAQVMHQVEVAIASMRKDGLLRDHRPLQCNADDYLRMVNVPSHKHACFRQMAGVVTNEDSEWKGRGFVCTVCCCCMARALVVRCG